MKPDTPVIPLDLAIVRCEALLRELVLSAATPQIRQAFLLQLAFVRPYHTWAIEAELTLSPDEYLSVVAHALAAIGVQAARQLQGPTGHTAAELSAEFKRHVIGHLGATVQVADVRRHNA